MSKYPRVTFVITILIYFIMDECIICWEIRQLTTLLPCGHAFCKRCIEKTFNLTARCRCPTCRVVCFKTDPPLVVHQQPPLIIEKEIGVMLGITMISNDNKEIVVNTGRKRCKLKKGDIIDSINGIPCYNTQIVADIVQHCTIPLIIHRHRIRHPTVLSELWKYIISKISTNQ